MDLSKFSDADLLALKSGDLAKVSDDGLARLKANQRSSPYKPDMAAAGKQALEGVGPIDRALISIGSGMSNLNPFQSREAVDEKKVLDAQANDTFMGKALSMGGEIVPTLAVPFGAAARGAGALLKGAGFVAQGAKVAGSKAADMILSGLALGAGAPVGTDDSRTGNALAGLAGGAVFPAVGGAWNVGKKLVAPFTEKGAQGIAGRTLADAGITPGLRAEEIVLGSKPTLAEASLNPAVAQMEKSLANRNPNFRADLGTRATEQNVARWGELNRVAGSVDDIARLEAARDAKAMPILESALSNSKVVDTGSLLRSMDQIAGGPTRLRSNATSAISDLRAKIEASNNAADLYAVRKELGDLLGGRVGSDKAGAKYAAKELMAVQEALDRELNRATRNKFGKYLETYADMSLPINRMQTAQHFAGKFERANPDALGLPMLTQQNWRNALSGAGDGFGPKASSASRMDNLLNVGDKGLMDDIGMDLLRQSQARQLTQARGSDTLQNIAGDNLLMKLLSPGMHSGPTGTILGEALQRIGSLRTNKPMAQLETALLDPSYAALIAGLGARTKGQSLPLLTSGSPNSLRALLEASRVGASRALPSAVGN